MTTHVIVLVPAVVVSVSVPPGPHSSRFFPCLPEEIWTTLVFFVQFHRRPGQFGPA